jgi:threonine dehydrogenase-like Zn-dependent dehydrogenase
MYEGSLMGSSDVHFWKHGQIGPTMIVRDTTGAGHESAGEIIAVGEDVGHLKVGDRVAIEAGVPCSMADCDACRTGRYNACEYLRLQHGQTGLMYRSTSCLLLYTSIPRYPYSVPRPPSWMAPQAA